jgi:hypothetical protein
MYTRDTFRGMCRAVTTSLGGTHAFAPSRAMAPCSTPFPFHQFDLRLGSQRQLQRGHRTRPRRPPRAPSRAANLFPSFGLRCSLRHFLVAAVELLILLSISVAAACGPGPFGVGFGASTETLSTVTAP